MLYRKSFRKALTAAALGLAMLVSSLQAEEALPEKALVYVQTNALKTMFNQVAAMNAVLGEAMPGMLPANPQMLQGLLFSVAGLTPDLVNLDGSLHIFVFDNDGPVPLATAILPVPDLDTTTAALKEQGWTVEAVAAVGGKRLTRGGDTALLAPLAGGVAVVENEDAYTQIKAMLGQWKPGAMPGGEKGPLLRCMIDLKQIGVKAEAPLQMLKGAATAQGKAVLEAGEDGAQNPLAKELEDAAVALSDSFLEALTTQPEKLQFRLYLDGAQIKVQSRLLAGEVGFLGELIQTGAALNPTAPVLSALPAKPLGISICHTSPALTSLLAGKMQPLWQPAMALLGEEMGEPGQQLLKDMDELMGVLMSQMNGDITEVMIPVGADKTPCAITYVKIADAAAMKSANKKLQAAIEEMFQLASKEAEKAGAPMEMSFKQESGEAAGTPFQVITFAPKAGGAMPAELVKDLPNAEFSTAVTDTYWVLALGEDARGGITEALKALSGEGAVKDEALLSLQEENRNSQFLFKAIYMNDLIKKTLLTLYEKVPEGLKQGPEAQMAQAFIPMLQAMPKDREPVLMTMGANGNALYSSLRIPVPSIATLVKTCMPMAIGYFASAMPAPDELMETEVEEDTKTEDF